MTDLAAIGRDLDACDLGLDLTTGKTRRAYVQHRKACFEAIREANESDGLDKLSDDELLAALQA